MNGQVLFFFCKSEMEETQLYHTTTTKNKLNKFVVVFLSIIVTIIFCVIIFQSYQVEQIKSVLKKEVEYLKLYSFITYWEWSSRLWYATIFTYTWLDSSLPIR